MTPVNFKVCKINGAWWVLAGGTDRGMTWSDCSAWKTWDAAIRRATTQADWSSLLERHRMVVVTA